MTNDPLCTTDFTNPHSTIVWDDCAKKILGNCYVSIFLSTKDASPNDWHHKKSNDNETEDQIDY